MSGESTSVRGEHERQGSVDDNHAEDTPPSPSRAQTAKSIVASARTDGRGRVDFKAFCEVMLPRDAEASLAEKLADYMAKAFV